MRVDRAAPRREVEQLERRRRGCQAHRQRGFARVRRARASVRGEAPEAECVEQPEGVVREPERQVERHVVGVVEAREEGKVARVPNECYGANDRPYAVYYGSWLAWGGVYWCCGQARALRDGVEVKEPNHCEVQAE